MGHETRLSIKHDASAVRLTDFTSHISGRRRWRAIPFAGLQITRTTLWVVMDINLLSRTVAKRKPEPKRTLADVDDDFGERRFPRL